MNLPFDGAISEFYRHQAPPEIRDALDKAGKNGIPTPDYPYPARMGHKDYRQQMQSLQVEMAKLQADLRETGRRVVVLFEGRDAAGKGGVIKRFSEHLNPRVARVVALGTPSDRERGQWYFQRYVDHMPSRGEMVFFDRSWYNRAVVEHVFGFCTSAERAVFFRQLSRFEHLIIDEGIHFVKLWLSVGQAEQLRRFLAREGDILKQWKLSRIDVEGLSKWTEYTKAIAETFERSHSPTAPWTVIKSDDKRRARIAAIRAVIHELDYAGKDAQVAIAPDPLICGGSELLDA